MKYITQKSLSLFVVLLIFSVVSIGGVAYAVSASQDDDGFCDTAAGVIVCCSTDDDGVVNGCKIVGPVVQEDE